MKAKKPSKVAISACENKIENEKTKAANGESGEEIMAYSAWQQINGR
jgi:hypothetical protein